MQKSIIKLNEKLFIGSGLFRFVYTHPDDSKCLKIQRHDKVKENKIDVKYHQHLIARNSPYEHLTIKQEILLFLPFKIRRIIRKLSLSLNKKINKI